MARDRATATGPRRVSRRWLSPASPSFIAASRFSAVKKGGRTPLLLLQLLEADAVAVAVAVALALAAVVMVGEPLLLAVAVVMVAPVPP